MHQAKKAALGAAINEGGASGVAGVRPGLRRVEHGRHVIFYREHEGGILVSRVLHRLRLSERHRLH